MSRKIHGNKGKKFSNSHKEKLSQAKLKNPVRYWLGKKGIHNYLKWFKMKYGEFECV